MNLWAVAYGSDSQYAVGTPLSPMKHWYPLGGERPLRGERAGRETPW